MTTGNKIRALRKSRKMTQTELGDRLGVKKNAVSKWECGRVDDIPASKIKALAQLFDVPVSYLIDDEEPGTDAAMFRTNFPFVVPQVRTLEPGQTLYPDFLIIGSDGKSKKYTCPDQVKETMWSLIDKVFSIPTNKLAATTQMLDALLSIK